MHLKRYRRETVKDALRAVREDLGPNALILSTRMVAAAGVRGWFGGRVVEVTAAAERPSVSVDRHVDEPPVRKSDRATDEVTARLQAAGLDAALARDVARALPAGRRRGATLDAIRETLELQLAPLAADDDSFAPLEVFVGPPGVGKTTTIAKIAARFVLRHSVDQLGLVSTDTYRIGARQQLANFARILRAPMHVAETSDELRRVLDGFSSKKLVLIDTAGMSQRDVRLAAQFETLRVEGHRVRTVLALSAGADRGCLAEALKVFQAASPEALIVTKLDEAAALGGVLSLAIRAALPIAYLADGQRVPEDLHLAAPKRFWLMHNAVRLTQNAVSPPDENELETSFGEMELANHG